MYRHSEPRNFADLHDNAGYGDALERTHSSLSNASVGGASSNVHRVLFNDLVEMVPLVQSLIDRKAKPSFTRRASLIYTKTPSTESLSKRISEPKERSAARSVPTRKQKNHAAKDQGKKCGHNQDGCLDSLSSRPLAVEEDKEELIALREQVESLQRKLFAKDELLKSAEVSKTQMSSIQAKIEDLKLQAAEKDSLTECTQLQLSDAKIKLADKQAEVEKLQWEAMASNKKAEELQHDLDSVKGDISSIMMLFEGLAKNYPNMSTDDYDVTPFHLNHLPQTDEWDETEKQKMEDARKAYIAAVSVAKEKHDADSIAAAANARLDLQSFYFKNIKN